MIVTEYLKNNTLIKHYSDAGMIMLQVETGAKYSEAIDILPCRYTYIETDKPIETENIEEEKLDNISNKE